MDDPGYLGLETFFFLRFYFANYALVLRPHLMKTTWPSQTWGQLQYISSNDTPITNQFQLQIPIPILPQK